MLETVASPKRRVRSALAVPHATSAAPRAPLAAPRAPLALPRAALGALVTLAAVTIAAASAPSQADLNVRSYRSPDGGGIAYEFGTGLLAADLDEDGFDDLIVMEPGAPYREFVRVGRGWVFYGPDFTETRSFASQFPMLNAEMGAVRGDVGDVDGDGTLDLLVLAPWYSTTGAPRSGRAHVFFGPTFERDVVIPNPTPEEDEHFGISGVLVDVTGDGRDDVVLGAWRAEVHLDGVEIDDLGAVYVYDSADLAAPLTVLLPPEPIESDTEFGSSLQVRPAKDGAPPELLVGARSRYACCPPNRGTVLRYALPSLEFLGEIVPPLEIDASAFDEIAYEGDLDGDGVDDFIAAAPWSDISSGLVFIAKGPDSTTTIATLPPPAPENYSLFGNDLHVADLDADGTPDILASNGGTGVAWAFYGPDYDAPVAFEAPPDVTFPSSAWWVTTGDFDGDDRLEVALALPYDYISFGVVLVYDPRTLTAEPEAISMQDGGEIDFLIDLGAGQAYSYYLTLVGVGTQRSGTLLGPTTFVPIDPDRSTLELLALTLDGALPGLAGQLTATGKAAFTLTLPANFAPALVGNTWTLAAVTLLADGRTPGIGTSTVEITFEP